MTQAKETLDQYNILKLEGKNRLEGLFEEKNRKRTALKELFSDNPSKLREESKEMRVKLHTEFKEKYKDLISKYQELLDKKNNDEEIFQNLLKEAKSLDPEGRIKENELRDIFFGVNEKSTPEGQRAQFEAQRKKGTNYITFLTDEFAKELISKHQGYLSLKRLTSLTDDQAESLSKHLGNLSLKGLTSLTDAQAESLSKLKGNLYLEGLTTLTDAQAESLSKHQGNLSLDGLTSLTDTQAESLSKHQGNLYLGGLTTLTDAQAESLSKHLGDLYLEGLTTLTDAQAESLSKLKGDLYLNGLTSLTDAQAESLSKLKGDLYLPYNLKKQVDVYHKK